MAALIVVVDGKEAKHELAEGPTLIGRHSDCAIAFSQPSVSGRHARIHGEGGVFSIEDAGSRNGTFVNQQRIEGRVTLHDNDALRFGDAVARFYDPALVRAADARPSSSRTVADVLRGTLELNAGQVDIDEAGAATITDKMAMTGRLGGLDVNPEAKLKAVLEISNHLAGTVDLSALLPKILDSLFSIFRDADRGCILLKDAQTGKMVPRAMRHRRKDEDSTVRLSRTIVDKVLSEKTGILSADAAMDAAFNASQSITDINIRSMMCVPLLGLDGEVLGILSIDSQNTLGQFTHDDLDILMTVAGQAALAYENARLVQIYAEKQKQDADLDIAKSVQRALLPTEMPKVAGYQLIERVLEFVKTGPAEAEQMGKLLLEDVRRHARGYPQSDDITIMTFGRNP